MGRFHGYITRICVAIQDTGSFEVVGAINAEHNVLAMPIASMASLAEKNPTLCVLVIFN